MFYVDVEDSRAATAEPRPLERRLGQASVEGVEELDRSGLVVDAAGYGDDRIQIDPSVVRGLEYYTGPVFETELLSRSPTRRARRCVFGSVGGGGRYDGLVSRFRGEPVPATGFSIGVSRLMTALKNLGKLGTPDAVGPVVVLVMDRDTDSLGRYQSMSRELRQAGIRAEMYLGGNRHEGADEICRPPRRAAAPSSRAATSAPQGTVQIKDLDRRQAPVRRDRGQRRLARSARRRR